MHDSMHDSDRDIDRDIDHDSGSVHKRARAGGSPQSTASGPGAQQQMFSGWGSMVTGKAMPYTPGIEKKLVADKVHHDYVYQAQCADLQVAQEIGAMAGMPPLDGAGNVHPSLWSPKLFPMNVGQLTDSKSVAKSMWQQIDQQITDNKAVINQVDDMSMLPRWSFDTIKTHEEQFKQHMHRVHDISPAIFVCMRETLFRVTPYMRNIGLDHDELLQKLQKQKLKMQNSIRTDKAQHYHFVSESELVLRFLFRCSITRPFMTTIAGRIMNKHEVCNRPGAWASTKTRHDLTREVDDALIRLWDDESMGATWVSRLQDTLTNHTLHWELLDHTVHQ